MITGLNEGSIWPSALFPVVTMSTHSGTRKGWVCPYVMLYCIFSGHYISSHETVFESARQIQMGICSTVYERIKQYTPLCQEHFQCNPFLAVRPACRSLKTLLQMKQNCNAFSSHVLWKVLGGSCKVSLQWQNLDSLLALIWYCTIICNSFIFCTTLGSLIPVLFIQNC